LKKFELFLEKLDEDDAAFEKSKGEEFEAERSFKFNKVCY